MSEPMSPRPAVSTPGFVHLHVHSAYSLLKGSIKVAKLADLAKADHQPALALTDMDNMFGALEFSEKLASAGIQPIVGAALSIDFGDTDHGARNGKALWGHVSVARMAMRKLDPAYIGRYLSRVGDQVLRSVGVYQIEGEGIQLFDSIDGDHFTIVGMPLLPLVAELRRLGAIDG